jgi:hypothetical protein
MSQCQNSNDDNRSTPVSIDPMDPEPGCSGQAPAPSHRDRQADPSLTQGGTTPPPPCPTPATPKASTSFPSPPLRSRLRSSRLGSLAPEWMRRTTTQSQEEDSDSQSESAPKHREGREGCPGKSPPRRPRELFPDGRPASNLQAIEQQAERAPIRQAAEVRGKSPLDDEDESGASSEFYCPLDEEVQIATRMMTAARSVVSNTNTTKQASSHHLHVHVH